MDQETTEELELPAESGTQPAPEPEATPEITPEAPPEPEPEASPETESSPEPEPSAEPESSPEPPAKKPDFRRRKRLYQGLLALFAAIFLTGGAILGWYAYDTNVDRSGWENRDGTYYYRDFHNRRITGWLELEGRTYYFAPDNTMVTGWETIGDQIYCFGTDGVMKTGWQDSPEGRYYFGTDGVMQTGWQTLEGRRYYLNPDGRMATGWLDRDGKRCHLSQDGAADTGRVLIDEDFYFFDDNGVMQTGWLTDSLGTSYFLPEGPMALGLQDIDGKRYSFGNDGFMETGWIQVNDYAYYLTEDGSAATGPQTIDGRTHYFTPQGIHIILVNASNPIPDYWDPEIVTLEGDWHQIAAVAREPMERMLADCEAAGNKVGINSTYRSTKNQKEIVELRTLEHMEAGMTYEQAYAETLLTAALPGTSEHEMGLAADLTGDDAKRWLGEHCWEYGFILRYPPEKQHITGIINEPWHFRYVGLEVSMAMKDTGLCLEEFLGAGPAK